MSIDMKIEDVARIAHEANRGLQVVQADPGIPLAESWDELSQEMQQSVVEGVIGVLDGNTPEESHESWRQFKIDRGWTHGAVKDEQAKTHPLLVAWDDLPAEARLKDELFAAIVDVFAEELEL